MLVPRFIQFLAISALISLSARAQEFADPDFYLIDSLDLDELTSYDKELIDTTLLLYHNTTSDTTELMLLEHIVDNCWHPEIWPRYNRFLISEVRKMLTVNTGQATRDRELYYLAGAISNVGFYYDESGDLMKALDYYHESLKLYESIENVQGIATTYNNLGVMYSVIGDTAKALEYHQQSLKFKKQIGDAQGIAMSYNNIGTLKENSKDYFVALEYYESSLKIREEINDIRGIAMCYDNIGDIYFKEKVYGKAQEYYTKSYDIWNELGIETGISAALTNLANLHYELGNYQEAKMHGIRSYMIAEQLGTPVDIENSSRSLIKIYKQEGNFRDALEFAMIYIDTRDKMRGDKNAEIALKKSMQYQYQKLAMQDSLQHQKERELQDVEMKKQQTQTYALYSGLGLLLIIIVVGIRSFQRKKKDNLKINEQKREVEEQKAEIEKQHVTLALTHKEISDSISYAKRIQDAILPSSDILSQLFEDGFIYYQPKDVVSGDFYWIVEQDEQVIFAVADCTGHGVPGAMVSVVCHNALNRAVREFEITDPGKILDKTREIVVETFEAKGGEVKDGMDISLCVLDKRSHSLSWAGANNPLYLVRANQQDKIETFTPDKQPIGRFEKASNFTSHQIEVEKGDTIYLFTDGYIDQFGGQNGKKFKHAKLRELLLRIQSTKLDAQAKEVQKELEDWMGAYEQVDDICLIGIRL